MENAAFYLLNVVSWARATGAHVYHFSALDENWKAAYEGEVGRHWGVADKNGVLKPGMRRAFNGETMADNWTLLGGLGTAEIELTHVPAYGSFDNLTGRVWHVAAADYRIVVYIYVNGWWIKPYFNWPLTVSSRDGRFVVDVTTGGSDQNATQIAACLVPTGYTPPALAGAATIPAEVDQNAVAKVEVSRSAS